MHTYTTEGELRALERAGWGLLSIPFLSEFLERGRWPSGPRDLITEVTVSALILCYIAFVRRARKRLVSLEKSRKTLLQLIIHDLKNPVACALGSLSYLQQSKGDDVKRDSLINLALNSCRQQSRMIDQVLEVDRMEMAELEIRREPIHVNDLVKECAKELYGIAGLKDVAVEHELAPSNPVLSSDRDLLKRVLMNILGNALKYTAEGGRVALKVSWSMNGAHFNVNDTGAGIPDDRRERLFDKFYRVEGNDQSKHSGMGLGLYFCRIAVEALGGKIDLKSEVGKGTSVDVFLPDRR